MLYIADFENDVVMVSLPNVDGYAATEQLAAFFIADDRLERFGETFCRALAEKYVEFMGAVPAGCKTISVMVDNADPFSPRVDVTYASLDRIGDLLNAALPQHRQSKPKNLFRWDSISYGQRFRPLPSAFGHIEDLCGVTNEEWAAAVTEWQKLADIQERKVYLRKKAV